MRVERTARERALERLAVDETEGLYNLALRLTGDTVEAENLVLEACRQMSARPSKHRGESSTRSWLYRALWETFVGWNGKPRTKPSGTAAGMPAGNRAVHGSRGGDRNKSVREDAFDAALMSLPDDCRAAAVLRWGEGFSYEEISWIMDRPRETVMSQIRRVYHDLRGDFLLGPTVRDRSHVSVPPAKSPGASPGAGTFRRLLLWIVLVTGSGVAAHAALTVDTTADGDDGECSVDCTIREAVATAMPGETVVVPAGTYSVSLGAIVIDQDLAIIGDGAHHTVIRGAVTPQRIFIIAAGASVEITGVSLSLDPDQSGGGGIRNEGDLLLRECWLRDSRNPLDLGGGALRNSLSGRATIERCTMSNNNSEFGGAIFNEGLMVIESTTISGNTNAFVAGGIINTGGDLTLSDSTVVGNEAQLAGAANIDNALGSLVLRNTVVGDGMNGPDCTGVLDATAGHNVDADGTCVASGGPGNSTADANLEPLVDNGGPVPTHAPGPGSPLIDAGNPATPGSGGDACAAIDARHVARPQGTVCDIGAFERAAGQDCAGGEADDADGDGVCRAEDNCPAGFNPGQGAVVFPYTVRAASSDRFVWDEPADVSFVRGDLSLVDVYATNGSGDLAAADSLTDAELPVAGAGFYYMLRLGGECTVGSWQTRHGGQPERDGSLP